MNPKKEKPMGTGEIEGRHMFSYRKTVDSESGLAFVLLRYEDRKDPRRNIQAAVVPEYGSNLVQFQVGGTDIFYTDKAVLKESGWTGCFVLWPLPNRYDRNGKKEYEFQGQVVSLEDIRRKEGNNPLIHGLVDDQPWQYNEPVVTAKDVRFKTRIAVIKGDQIYSYFPFESELALQYVLGKDGLTVIYTVTNNDDHDMPSVFALHPYYKLLGGRENTLVRVPARSVMKANDELLPTGEVIPVKGTEYDLNQPKAVKGMMFDDVFTDLKPKQYPYVKYPKLGLRVSHITSGDFTHAVLFTRLEKDSGFICLEPQTGATNAINLDAKAQKEKNERLAKAAHVLVIPPKRYHSGYIKFAVDITESRRT